jgi:hypothetical protein
MHPDFYNDDAFSLVTLTTVINDMPHIPGRAGELVFAGIGKGVPTTSVDVELDTETLTLIPFSTRGAPDFTNGFDKRALKSVDIPHVSLSEGIVADQIQDVREFGTMSGLISARSAVDRQMGKQAGRHDLTLEHLRLGALSGVVADKNGVVAENLFTLFGVSEVVVDFDDVFVTAAASEDTLQTLQGKCFNIGIAMKRAVRGPWFSSAKIWAFCGDVFFRKLVATIGATAVRGARADAKISLGDGYAHGVVEFGDIFWESYQGTDDANATSGGTVGVAPNECRFFITGYPGLYAEYYAPADFIDAVNTIALPRYARVAPTDAMNRALTLHTQQNSLPLCLKPKTLFKGTSTPNTEDIDFYVEL